MGFKNRFFGRCHRITSGKDMGDETYTAKGHKLTLGKVDSKRDVSLIWLRGDVSVCGREQAGGFRRTR